MPLHRAIPTQLTLQELQRVVNRLYDQIDFGSSSDSIKPSRNSPTAGYSGTFGLNPAHQTGGGSSGGGGASAGDSSSTIDIIAIVEDPSTGEPELDSYGYGYMVTVRVKGYLP